MIYIHTVYFLMLSKSQDEVAHFQIFFLNFPSLFSDFHHTPFAFQAWHNLVQMLCSFTVCTLCFWYSLSFCQADIWMLWTLRWVECNEEESGARVYEIISVCKVMLWVLPSSSDVWTPKCQTCRCIHTPLEQNALSTSVMLLDQDVSFLNFGKKKSLLMPSAFNC